MNPSHTSFSEKSKELLFVLTPPTPLQETVSHFKKDAESLVGYPYKSRYAKAHITLGYCITDQPLKLIWSIADKMQTHAPFHIHIKDCRPLLHGENRSICLDVANKSTVTDITDNLSELTETTDTPHLTIARNLPYEDFAKAWPYFQNIHYSNNFICDRITVLERAGNRWIPYEQIPLAG